MTKYLMLLLGLFSIAQANEIALIETCNACHGASGVSSNPEWPNLAGQQSAYLIKEISAFKNGDRANPIMPASLLQQFSDSQIKSIANYYTSLPTAEVATLDSNLAGGYVRARCVSCHGMTGSTVTSLWPNVAGQKSAYLKTQLLDYKSGKRLHPMMQVIASELSEQEISDVADYYGGK
jgi:cytochrome c553